MPRTIRPATTDDISRMVPLLVEDARQRHARDASLWAMADDPGAEIETALLFALTADRQPFRQFWLVAEEDGRMTGIVHAMMLPVPPIYAGDQGDPGLIMPDSVAAPDAPEGTVDALVDAAEEALRKAGARILLSAVVAGRDWQSAYDRRSYRPLTLYLSRRVPEPSEAPAGIRPATEADVPGIVSRSAENRRILFDIDPFWAIHPEADARFGAWMSRSLTLGDRDLLVQGAPDAIDGYVIAQPASRLHFPPAHDIARTGVIDDFHHRDLGDFAAPARGGADGSAALLEADCAAFRSRGVETAFAVCPAGWRSKLDLLRGAGFETAMTWSIREPAAPTSR